MKVLLRMNNGQLNRPTRTIETSFESYTVFSNYIMPKRVHFLQYFPKNYFSTGFLEFQLKKLRIPLKEKIKNESSYSDTVISENGWILYKY